MAKSLLMFILLAVSTVNWAESPESTTEKDSTSLVNQLVAARQFLDSALVRKIVQEGLKSEFKDLDDNQANKILNSLFSRFKENPLLLTTLAKYFSIQELNAFAQFLNTEEALSVTSKITQQLSSETFKRDFKRVEDEIAALLEEVAKK